MRYFRKNYTSLEIKTQRQETIDNQNLEPKLNVPGK
jgi:hypothetical protein